MPKIKFDNGVVMTLDREPSGQEIEELGKIAMSQGRPPSIASQGMSYVAEHPFKTIFQPISQTLTGKSIGERTDLLNKAGTALVDQSGIDVQKNLQEQLARGRTLSVPKTPGMGEFFMRQLPAATAQAGITLADVSPFDVATIGLFPKVGKIPVGSTTVARIAKKVDVGPGFIKGVGELQRLESALRQSGRLSSRGIPVTAAPLDVRSTNTIWGLYNEIAGTKFKKVSDVTQAKPQRVAAMRTISENLNNVKLPNPQTGELETRIPATRLELLDAFRQTKSSVWQKVNQLSSGATEKQAQINLPELAQQALQKTKGDIGDVALTTDKTLLTALEETVDRIRKSGVISPTQSESYMKFLNNEIQRLRNSGQAVDFSVKDLYSNLLHNLNEATDQAIESALGTSGYRTFRNQYSSLKSAEKELLGASNSFIKQTSGRTGDVTHPIANLWALEEFLKGTGQIAMGNVAGGVKSIGQGVLAKTAVRILDHFRLPDRKISEIFQTVSKAKTLPVKQTFTPSQRPGIFPFPEGPTTFRRPLQGPPQLPYSTKQLPYLGRAPYKPTGYPGGVPPQKPMITPYEPGGATIRGQAPYRGTTLPAISPQPITPRQPLNLEQLRKSLQRKTQGQPLRGRHEVSPEQVIELPPRQAPQGKPGIVEGEAALIAEAKKYKTAEEFVRNARGNATQYGKYNPKIRAISKLFKDSERISNLGIEPDLEVTIYRGVPDPKIQKITDGDFVTTDKLSAESFSGKGNFVSKRVKAKDLIVDSSLEFDKTKPFGIGAEFVYSDSKKNLNYYTEQQLTSLWQKAQEQKIVKGKPLTAAEAVKQSGQLIRIATKIESTSQSAKNKAFNSFSKKEGMQIVYKPYGEQGKGFYYVPETGRTGFESTKAQPLTAQQAVKQGMGAEGGAWVKDLKNLEAWNDPARLKRELQDMIYDLKNASASWKSELTNDIGLVVDRLDELTGKFRTEDYVIKPSHQNPLRNKSGQASKSILGPTMATGIGLAAALKATAVRGETGEVLDHKYKQQIANAENYRETTGDWAQLEDIALRDLKRIGKLKQNVTLEQVRKDPQLYDKVVKLYWDRLDAFGIPEKDKALWWLMPGRYRQTGGDISRLKNPEHRNIMQNRVKNIKGGK